MITLTRNLREKENIKIRQPLSKIYVAFTKDYKEIIKTVQGLTVKYNIDTII